MAQGRKVFKNTTNQPLQVILNVRQGDDPSGDAGTVIFQVGPGQSVTQTYGTDTNSVYLNGLAVDVVTRGSSFDNLLNTNNTITFAPGSNNSITISGSNT